MGLNKKYRKSLAKNWCLRFQTRHPDGDCYDGIVTHIKPKFIVLAEMEGVEFDGVNILSKNFLKGYRDSKYEKFSNELIRESGVIDKLCAPDWLDSCDTLREVLAAMMERDIWPAVEMSGSGKGFYLGPVTKIARKHFQLYCYDAAGNWEAQYWLRYSEVWRLEFDDRYCNNFNAYMKKHYQDEG